MSKELTESIGRFLALKGQCYEQVLEDLNLSELSLKQLKYIKKLNCDEGITVSQIAESFGLSKPKVTEMIKKFVKAELVCKKICVSDGRVHYIELTDKGRAIASLESKTVEYLDVILREQLNEDEICNLVDILNKL